MKKNITYRALFVYLYNFFQDQEGPITPMNHEIAMALDIDHPSIARASLITKAQRERFLSVLSEMGEKAEKKL